MVVDELGEYLILKGYAELDSTRFKRGNKMVTLGIRGGYDTWRITESGEFISQGVGLTSLINAIK